MEPSTTQDQWEDQEPEGQMWFRGSKLGGGADGGEELKTGTSGGTL
jgi:hypothetical protein